MSANLIPGTDPRLTTQSLALKPLSRSRLLPKRFPKKKLPLLKAAVACARTAARLYVVLAYREYQWGSVRSLVEETQATADALRQFGLPTGGCVPFLDAYRESACAACLAFAEHVLGRVGDALNHCIPRWDEEGNEFKSALPPQWATPDPDPNRLTSINFFEDDVGDILREHYHVPDPYRIMLEAIKELSPEPKQKVKRQETRPLAAALEVRPNDWNILAAVAQDPRRSVSHQQIEDALRSRKQSLSRNTIYDGLKRLRDAGLVSQPTGKRGCFAVTGLGQTTLGNDSGPT